jgi:ankyrin repeat protein
MKKSSVRENWIRAKYGLKSFVKPFKPMRIKINANNDVNNKSDNVNARTFKLQVVEDEQLLEDGLVEIENPSDLLHVASAYASLELMMYALALDADRNSIIDKMDFYSNVEADVSVEEVPTNTAKFGFTPLIKAVHSGSIQAVELLILNGAKLTICDFNGRSPLHHATILKNLRFVNVNAGF